MRHILELEEQIDEVNYFLREWQFLKTHKDLPKAKLQEPEIRFIARTLERLIREAESLSVPIMLQPDGHTRTAIELSECLKLTNKHGQKVAYVGNKHGLLSLSKIAEMVSHGGELVLMQAAISD